jgi:hypothetical protein
VPEIHVSAPESLYIDFGPWNGSLKRSIENKWNKSPRKEQWNIRPHKNRGRDIVGGTVGSSAQGTTQGILETSDNGFNEVWRRTSPRVANGLFS